MVNWLLTLMSLKGELKRTASPRFGPLCWSVSRLETLVFRVQLYNLFRISSTQYRQKTINLICCGFYPVIHWEHFNELVEDEHVFHDTYTNTKNDNLMQAGLYLVTRDNSFYSRHCRDFHCRGPQTGGLLRPVTNTNLCKVIQLLEITK